MSDVYQVIAHGYIRYSGGEIDEAQRMAEETTAMYGPLAIGCWHNGHDVPLCRFQPTEVMNHEEN